jgi:uroporphyrinogen III methyltransferase / synthase
MGPVRVVVTRPADGAAELVRGLEERGHEVAVCPLIAVEPLGDAPVDVRAYDWVVVTSANGARELARRAAGVPRRVAAIGPGTARALRESGIEPALVARVSTQEGLLDELPRPAGRVLFAGAEGARRLLVDRLGAEFLPLYRTRELRPERFPEDADLVVLASASAARAFGRLGIRVPAVSIGPQTSAAADAAGVKIAVEARTHDVEGLLEAVTRACSSPS